MDPYLEEPTLWAGVHQRLIIAIANALAPKLRPKYIVAVEERVYETLGDEALLVGVPDDAIARSIPPPEDLERTPAPARYSEPTSVTVTLPMPETQREGYLEIRRVGTEDVITLVEVLSPKNKRPGEGRVQYEAKRRKVLASMTHLVEIDLLRQWPPMPILNYAHTSHYRMLVSRSSMRPQATLYPFNLPEPVPTVLIPLEAEDEEQALDLQPLLTELYDLGGYDLRIDYQQSPPPPLTESDLTWIEQHLQSQGLR
jgi:hypothetical protein